MFFSFFSITDFLNSCYSFLSLKINLSFLLCASLLVYNVLENNAYMSFVKWHEFEHIQMWTPMFPYYGLFQHIRACIRVFRLGNKRLLHNETCFVWRVTPVFLFFSSITTPPAIFSFFYLIISSKSLQRRSSL